MEGSVTLRSALFHHFGGGLSWPHCLQGTESGRNALSVLSARIQAMSHLPNDRATRKTSHGEDQLFLMLEWLTFYPTAEEIARGLVTSYLSHHGLARARFSLQAEDDSLLHIGQHGFKNFPIGRVESAEQWRSRDREDATRDCMLDENCLGRIT